MTLTPFLVVVLAASSPEASDVQKNTGSQDPPVNYQATAPSTPTLITHSGGGEWQSKNQKPSDSKNRFLSWCDSYQVVINLISTALVAVFTGILTWYTILLWTSGEKHSERELRAYVLLTKASIHHFEINGTMTAKVEIENTGQTPALDLDVFLRFDVHSWPREEFLIKESSSLFTSSTVLGPRVPIDVTLPFPVILTKEQRDKLVQGEMGLFVLGTRVTQMSSKRGERLTFEWPS